MRGAPGKPLRPRPGAHSQGRLLAAIFAGGVLGALARAAVERGFPAGSGWPWGTFAVNIAGTALLGYAVTRLQERLPPSTYPRPLIGTGFCGALTTFSTLQVEVIRLARQHHAGLAAVYLAATLAAGLAAMHLTTAAVRRARLR